MGLALPLAGALSRWLLLPAGKQTNARPGGLGEQFSASLQKDSFYLAIIPVIILTYWLGWAGSRGDRSCPCVCLADFPYRTDAFGRNDRRCLWFGRGAGGGAGVDRLLREGDCEKSALPLLAPPRTLCRMTFCRMCNFWLEKWTTWNWSSLRWMKVKIICRMTRYLTRFIKPFGQPDLTCTVHLPLDLRLGDDQENQALSITKALRVIPADGAIETLGLRAAPGWPQRPHGLRFPGMGRMDPTNPSGIRPSGWRVGRAALVIGGKPGWISPGLLGSGLRRNAFQPMRGYWASLERRI